MNRIWEGLRVWSKYSLLWILLTFILRISFFFVMLAAGLVQVSSFMTILSGVYFDVAVVLEAGAIAIVPFLIIYCFLPETARVLSIFFITLYAVIYGCLIGYYSNVNLPLDRVFFVYGPGEMYDIVVSSVRFTIMPLLGIAVIAALYWLLVRFWNRKVAVSKAFSLCFLSLTLFFAIFLNFKALITNDKHYDSYQDYCLAANQLAYTLNDFDEYWREKARAEDFASYDGQVLADAVSFQRLFPDFNYVDIHYPFMRESDDPDVLGDLMNPTNDGEAPAFVFVIVESLGQRLSSDRPEMSFTPFLDSLKKESLYWPNCLALSERTFGALPNIFSSAPYGKTGFASIWHPIPHHNSILKEMLLNDYTLSFYYGGNASFDGQDEFMRGNGVGYIMKPSETDFDQEMKEQMMKENSWGMYDKDMFDAAIRHRDTTSRNRRNTDVFITLSTHEPWCFEGNEIYTEKVENMVENTESFGPAEKNTVLSNKKTFASFLYMDDCLKMLLDYYKSQPEYENTVFVIVGDHRMGRVYVNPSPLLKYNVPLIVYSPLLKAPKTFEAVVTHHDIAPTVTAYLAKNYDYISADECHWLGTSLDTSAAYRCRQSVSFMRNSREEIEYLHGDFLLDRDRVFKVSESLEIKEIFDDAVRDSLTEYLRRYKNVDIYVTQNDYLWKKSSDVIELCIETDENLSSKAFVENEWFDIMKPYRFKHNYKEIYIEIEFDYTNGNNADLDKIYTEFRMKNQSVDFFRSYKLSDLSTANDDGSMHYMIKTTFFIAGDEVKNADFNINMFSQVKFDFEYKNLKIKVEGLPFEK